MQTAPIDLSILPEQARTELHDFYHFLVGKYAPARRCQAKQQDTALGTAAALAASPLAGMWKNRNLPDSPVFARTLRDAAQNRNLS